MNFANRDLSRSESYESAAYDAAVQVAIWGTPIVSLDAMRQAFFRDAQAGYNDILFWSKPADWQFQVPTPNASSHYVFFNFNTREGPLVLEIPAAVEAGLFGSILDAWQVPLADIGPEGEDRGKGGKYLLLPPDYAANVPAGYIPVLPETYNGYSAFRAIPKGSSEEDTEKAIALIRKIRIYPFSSAADPPQTRFIDMSGKLFDGIVRFDESFFESLSRMINEEPEHPRDQAAIEHLRVIGIEKGKDFKPGANMQDVLKNAAAEVQAQFISEASNDGARYWPDLHWRSASITGAETGFSFETAHGLDVNSRGLFYFVACAPPAKLGKATFYLMASVDTSGQPLTGRNNYRLHVPANVPANQFWALTLYDSETAAFSRNSPRVELNSYNQEIRKNADGSVDLYLGPKPPALKEPNWIYTAPGRNFFTIFRLYGPEKPIFDKTWRLPDIERIERKMRS
jgi:hypothetical protein